MPLASRLTVCAVLCGVFLVSSMTPASPENSVDPVTAFAADFLRRYPDSEARDIYKLLYQACHGAEHALGDTGSTRRFLREEWNQTEPIIPDEEHPLLEPIFLDGITPSLYRLHLGPAKALGIPLETVLDEFLRAGVEFPSSYPTDEDNLDDVFEDAWTQVGKAIAQDKLPLGLEDYAQLSAELEAAGWPPTHHSDAYRSAYEPHYRLVISLDCVDYSTD